MAPWKFGSIFRALRFHNRQLHAITHVTFRKYHDIVPTWGKIMHEAGMSGLMENGLIIKYLLKELQNGWNFRFDF
jgi:hypothetical protein